MSASDTQNVDYSTISTEETPVIKAIGIHSTIEPFRKSESELHSIFVADLGYYET